MGAQDPIEYDDIEPLIEDQRVDGSTLHVTFVCPATGQQVQARAGIRRGKDLGDRLGQSLKRSFVYEIRRVFMQFLSGLLGGGFGSRMARSAAGEVTRSAHQSVRYSGSDKKAAAVEAFRSVEEQFARDPSGGWRLSG